VSAYDVLTTQQSARGRPSKLGNSVQNMKPKELLSSMHHKTYFKGGQTIKLGKGHKDNNPFMKRKDIMNRFKEI
jgi:hypothetical protein